MLPPVEKRIFLLLAWLTLLLMGTDVFIMSPILPLIAHSYSVTAARAGWGVTVFALAYAALAPLFGHHGDRHGRRTPLVMGLVMLGMGNGATALAPRFGIFLFARFVAGGAAAAITPTIYAATGDVAPAKKRGAWLAIVGSGVFTALWSSAPIGSLLGYHYGWQNVFWILTAVPFFLAGGHTLLLRSTTTINEPPSGAYGPLLKNVTATLIWGASLYGTYTYLGAGLTTVTHCTPTQIALGVASYGVGMVSGGLLGGHLADRFGTRRITSISCAGLAVASLVLRAAMPNVVFALVALFFFSFSAALFFPAFQTSLVHQHTDRHGAALAWNNSALYFGITAGSFLGGVLLERVGFLAVPVLSCAFALLALAWSRRVQR